jgi:hypothetical protein
VGTLFENHVAVLLDSFRVEILFYELETSNFFELETLFYDVETLIGHEI